MTTSSLTQSSCPMKMTNSGDNEDDDCNSENNDASAAGSFSSMKALDMVGVLKDYVLALPAAKGRDANDALAPIDK